MIPKLLDESCYEAFNIQVHGLMTRLRATGVNKVVLGISGGLDSTHALIVAARAFDRLGLPRKNILCLHAAWLCDVEAAPRPTPMR